MKKSTYFLIATVLVAFLGACGGGNNKKLNTFAESFAEYVTSGDMDSVKVYYPTADFDSLASVPTDSIQITDNDGVYKINYGSGQWIEVKIGEDGAITVVSSKGIASFPKDKYEIGIKTGMITDSIDDIKTQHLLNDSTYFSWLNEQTRKSYDNILTVSSGSVKKSIDYAHDCYKLTLPITITNNSKEKFGPDDYEIAYSYNQSIWVGEGTFKPKNFSKKVNGKEVGPGESVTMSISVSGNSISNPHAVLKMPIEEYMAKYYTPTGKEYQEYLDSKK